MFDLIQNTSKYKQYLHDKIHGLPVKHRQKDKPKQHISVTINYDEQAETEGKHIDNAYKNRSMDFGRRLRKAKGQKHHPGGAYS